MKAMLGCIGLVVGIVLVLSGIAFVGYLAFTNVIVPIFHDPRDANVGDCVTDVYSGDDTRTVDCSSSDAAYKVIGFDDDSSHDMFTACKEYPEATMRLSVDYRGLCLMAYGK